MNRRDCGRRTAHEPHHWESREAPGRGSLVGVAHTLHWWCDGVPPGIPVDHAPAPPWYGQVDSTREDELLAQQTLVKRGDTPPAYITGVAADTIPAGARYFLDTATGTLHAHRPQHSDTGGNDPTGQESTR